MIIQLLLIDFIYTFVFAVAADSLVIVVFVVVVVVGGGVEKTFMRAVGRRSIGQRNNN